MTKDDLVPNMTSAVAEKVCHRKPRRKAAWRASWLFIEKKFIVVFSCHLSAMFLTPSDLVLGAPAIIHMTPGKQTSCPLGLRVTSPVFPSSEYWVSLARVGLTTRIPNHRSRDID